MPCVWAPSTSNGYGVVRFGSEADWSASTPTWGPLPWVITSSCSRARGASALTARTALLSWISASGLCPRWSRALPPRAATMRTSVAEGGHEHGLDGVHPVLGLIEHDRVR